MRATRGISALLVVALLSSCSSPWSSSPAAEEGLRLARQLHELPIDGFTFAAVDEPDMGFSYNNPNSGFMATPKSGQLTATECQAVVAWIKANLSAIKIALQYSTGAPGQEIAACLTAAYGLLKNSSPGLTYTGIYEGRFVYVVYEGASNGQFGIVVSGAESTDIMPYDAGNSTLAANVQKLLNALAAYRAEQKISSFTEKQFSMFWQKYQKETGTTAKVGWSADSDGFVRSVQIENLSGLLPFNLWIDPVNEELVGPDPGSPYLFVLGAAAGPKSFGFGWDAQS